MEELYSAVRKLDDESSHEYVAAVADPASSVGRVTRGAASLSGSFQSARGVWL